MPETSESGARVRTVLMTADTIGGVWTYALELARGLAPYGWRVELATMGAPLTPSQRAEAEALPSLALHESTFALEWMPNPWEDVDRAGAWLLALEERLRPDVIHLNGYGHGALGWRAPALVVAHSCVLSWWQAVKGEPAPPEWDEYHTRVQRGLEGARLLAAPTRAMLEEITRLYGEHADQHVVPNGRSPELFSPAPKEPFILAAGRLGDEAKNIAALGRAAEGLDWPVFVAGNPSDPSGAQALPRKVTPLGLLSPAQLGERLGRAAIYCLPARYEPFGLSILEAALAGCALVLGDIPSLRELWEGAAAFVPPGDDRALQASLRRMIEQQAERENLGRSARERALTFTIERCGAAYHQLYRTLLSPAAPTS